jgi:SAM-dependent methyltransferase
MILESSPATLRGSCTDDLLISKLHLARTLKKLRHDSHDRIYNLGSWYGNMAPILNHQGIKFNQLFNVDRNPDVVANASKIADYFDMKHSIKHLTGDANRLRYKNPSMIINTSCNDIEGSGWFDRIPKGTLVALQTRDMPNFKTLFPLSETLHFSRLNLKDPEEKYTRLTWIGIK